MRTLFLALTLRNGGAERQLAQLVKGLARRGVEAHVATLEPEGLFWDELRDAGCCTLIDLQRKRRWDYSVVPWLVRYVRDKRVELIQGWMSPTNSIAALVGLRTRRPALMAMRVSNSKWSTVAGLLFRYIEVALSRTPAVRKVICNSQRGRRCAKERGFPDRKLAVIPNGVVLPANVDCAEPLAGLPPARIAMVARLHPMKDHLTMFRALRMLIDSRREVELWVVGDGAPALASALKESTQDLDIAARVRWLGVVSDIWEVLNRVDFVVLSSAYGEGMSNALLEGMALGRIVVATDVGDSWSLLERPDGPCGYFAQPRDPKSLAEALSEAMDKPDQARERARRARRAARSYEIETMVDSYARLYASLTGPARA